MHAKRVIIGKIWNELGKSYYGKQIENVGEGDIIVAIRHYLSNKYVGNLQTDDIIEHLHRVL